MKPNLTIKHQQIYTTLTSLLREGWMKSAAVRETANRYNVSDMTVYRIIRNRCSK